MKKLTRNGFVTVWLITLTLVMHAQTSTQKKSTGGTKTSSTKTGAKDTAAAAPKTKMEKTVDQGNTYVKMADDEKTMFKKLFPSKGDTVYAVIAGISYADPNLKLLKQQMSNVKNAKNLTSGYHKGSVIIKVVYKNGDASTLYDSLGDDIKELFPVDDMEGMRMILDYRDAKTSESPKQQ